LKSVNPDTLQSQTLVVSGQPLEMHLLEKLPHNNLTIEGLVTLIDGAVKSQHTSVGNADVYLVLDETGANRLIVGCSGEFIAVDVARLQV
jgi:hypothetical protein